MRLLVTQFDIDHSHPQRSRECAIATAISRVTGGLEAQVGGEDVWIIGFNIRGTLDRAGQLLVSMFDGYKDMCRPTVVEITFPADCTEPLLLCDYVTDVKLSDVVTQKSIRNPNSAPVYSKEVLTPA